MRRPPLAHPNADAEAAHPMIGTDRPPGPAVGSPGPGASRVAVAATSVLGLAFAALTLAVWRDRAPLAADRQVLRWLTQLPVDDSTGWVGAVARLGSVLPAVLWGSALFAWAARRHDRRLATLTIGGPVLAVVLSQLVGKPVIGRQLGPSFDFPSGHATAAAALATTSVVLLLTWHEGRRWARLGLGSLACLVALAVAVAVVVIGWHVPSSSLGGVIAGVGIVLGVTAACQQWLPADRPLVERAAHRALYAGLALGAVVLAGSIRLPYLVLSPGSLIPLNDAVQVPPDAAAGAGPLNGTYSGLTVRSTGLTIGVWAWHELRSSPDPIVARELVIPPGESGQQYRSEQRQVFVSASEVAVAVAEQALGLDVQITGDGALVTGVLEGAPASGHLVEGDVITAIDGRPVTTDRQLRDALAAAAARLGADAAGDPGATVDVEVALRDADGNERQERITLRRLESTGRLGLGVGVTTANLAFELPTDVTVDGGDVGGPSAGLLTALTVYDALSADDLAAGRHITGTGTLSVDGTVGDVGGIEEKVRAAVASGADVFLAPAQQADDAEDASDHRVRVVPVATFAEAVAALRTPVAS